MDLDHAFVLPVSVDDAWRAVDDLGRLVACLPGTHVDHIEGDECEGEVRLRVGLLTLRYRGIAHVVERDEDQHMVVIEAVGQPTLGPGAPTARLEVFVLPWEGQTIVTVSTEVHANGTVSRLGATPLRLAHAGFWNAFGRNLSADLIAAAA